MGMKRIVSAGLAAMAAMALVVMPAMATGRAELVMPADYPEYRWADLPGVRLAYWDTGGNGPAVVLNHPGTGSSQIWEHQIKPFTAAGYRLIGIDRRSYGKTELLTDPTGPQGTGADDLDNLMKHLGIETFHAVGSAAGGIVVTDYALSFPQKLRSAVVANSTGGVQNPEYTAQSARIRPAPTFGANPPEFREVGPSYRAENPAGTQRWIDLEHIARTPGPLPTAQTQKNRLTFELLGTIKVPMLQITGDADLYTPPAVQRQFLRAMPFSEGLVLAEVGHSGYWEQPEAWNKAVLEFIGRQEAIRRNAGLS
jgi:pimeloyl-ACP methyl ester carboxylesterase